ncbi:lactonase family protein [Terriglobus sp. RCC_193]|uniref:lactonase family protein n=1 Tax=Terriglobus sp. RCC_193 TaxID=3239218 RepID=UPI003525D1FE
MNRRHFSFGLPATAFALRSFAIQPTLSLHRKTAFIGTTGKEAQGIFQTSFDAKTGTFAPPDMAAKLPGNDSMTLHPHQRNHLYSTAVVNGIAAVQGFEITGSAEQPLRPINQQTAKGNGPNFLSIDPSGRVAMEANWGSGDISTYRIDRNGELSPYVEHIEYGADHHGPQPVQIHSRCHSILTAPGGRFVLVNDYGCDRIYIYALNAEMAKLTPHNPPFYAAAPGSAPRHLVFHPNGRWIYCNNELTNTVDLLDWDAKHGTLKLRESMSTLPLDAPPKCRTADMALSADHRYLYCSVRTLESFVTYAVESNGTLRRIQFLPSQGVENRCITLDSTGHWLIAANQRSNDVSVLPRDPKTGLLSAQTSSIKIPGACYVLWA